MPWSPGCRSRSALASSWPSTGPWARVAASPSRPWIRADRATRAGCTPTSRTGDAVFTGFGRKGVRAEQVAAEAIEAYTAWYGVGVPVCEHLADQLLLPVLFAGQGSFSTVEPSLHTRTNAEVITHFTGRHFAFEAHRRGAWRVSLSDGGE